MIYAITFATINMRSRFETNLVGILRTEIALAGKKKEIEVESFQPGPSNEGTEQWMSYAYDFAVRAESVRVAIIEAKYLRENEDLPPSWNSEQHSILCKLEKLRLPIFYTYNTNEQFSHYQGGQFALYTCMTSYPSRLLDRRGGFNKANHFPFWNLLSSLWHAEPKTKSSWAENASSLTFEDDLEKLNNECLLILVAKALDRTKLIELDRISFRRALNLVLSITQELTRQHIIETTPPPPDQSFEISP